jgi:hypothetical protein
MRRGYRTIGIVTALALVLGAGAVQAQPLLAGSWVLDRSQSQLPTWHGRGHDTQAAPQGTPPEIKLLVEQQGNVLKATRAMARGNTERSTSVTYVTDGTDQAYQGHRGNSVTRAVFEGDRLVVTKTHTMQGQQGERTMSREALWTVSPDGKVLTIDTTFQSPRGTRTVKAVYRRG